MWATKRTEFMKSDQNVRKIESLLQKTALLVLLATAAGLPAIQRTEAAANVVVWDTGAHFADAVDVADKTGWKPVPADLLTLEADPPKAASDPGYYGREYAFQGDAVVENRSLAAVFWSAKGRVVIYSKANPTQPGGASSGNSGLGRKILEFTPLLPKAKQQLKLGLNQEQSGKRLIDSIDFDNDGQGLYLAALGAPGIWHREELKPAYLEKDVAINWKRPFPAKWKTQLSEAGVKTTFT